MDVFVDNLATDPSTASCVTLEMVLVAGVIALVLGIRPGGDAGVADRPLARWSARLRLHGPQHAAAGDHAHRCVRHARPRLPTDGLSFGDADLLQFNVFFIFATAALGLYTAAFVCEALRSGINSIPLGQAEAARSIGMTFSQTPAPSSSCRRRSAR